MSSTERRPKIIDLICDDITRVLSKDVLATISSSKVLLLLALDFVFVQTVINTLSTATWRGVWNLLDVFFSGDNGHWIPPLKTEVLLLFTLKTY